MCIRDRLPGVAMQISVYEIMTKLGFINSLLGYIIMMCGTDVISIYIYIQFFENIDYSLDESGIMDGASYFTIFYRILPVSYTHLFKKKVMARIFEVTAE